MQAFDFSLLRPVLETPRLFLRPFDLGDVQALFALMSDEQVNTFLPWFPVKTLEEAEAMLRSRYCGGEGAHYAICLGRGEPPVGYVSVGPGDSFDLGYGLARAHWRKGIVPEAAGAVVEELRRAGLPYVTATHDVNNPASGAVMRKIGMTYRYSYQELWQPKGQLVTFRMYQLNLDGQDDRVYRAYWDRYPVHTVEKLECAPAGAQENQEAIEKCNPR